MSAHVTPTSMAQTAMILMGSNEEITNIDDTSSVNARTMKRLWPGARREALTLHPWNFALKIVKLLPESANPDERGFLSYALPGDCLRWLPWGNDDCERFDGEQVGGDLLTTQIGSIWVRYIFDNEDVSTWPPLFVAAMENRLAFMAVLGKSNSVGIRDRLDTDLDRALAAAKHADGQATGNRSLGRVATGSRLAMARTGGIRPWGY